MNEHNSSGSSVAQLMNRPVRDVQLSPMAERRQAHPLLSPVFVRLLVFVTVALAFSGLVNHLVYAIHWLTSSGTRAS